MMDKEKLERLRERMRKEKGYERIIHLPVVRKTDKELIAEVDEWLKKQGL